MREVLGPAARVTTALMLASEAVPVPEQEHERLMTCARRGRPVRAQPIAAVSSSTTADAADHAFMARALLRFRFPSVQKPASRVSSTWSR